MWPCAPLHLQSLSHAKALWDHLSPGNCSHAVASILSPRKLRSARSDDQHAGARVAFAGCALVRFEAANHLKMRATVGRAFAVGSKNFYMLLQVARSSFKASAGRSVVNHSHVDDVRAGCRGADGGVDGADHADSAFSFAIDTAAGAQAAVIVGRHARHANSCGAAGPTGTGGRAAARCSSGS